MTDKVKDKAPDALDVPAAPAAEVDERDAVIAALEAEVDRLKNPEGAPPEDPKDRAIWDLRRQRAELMKTPEGALEELKRAYAALERKVAEMQAGTNLIPVPAGDGPDPYLFGVLLATGEVIFAQHPHATHAHSPQFDFAVPVQSYFRLPDSEIERATQWAQDYAAALETAGR